MMVRTLITAAALIAASAGATLAQDVDKGATVFKKCGICHKIGPGATNLVGPELNGLDGRHSGRVRRLQLFTDANKNSGIVWGEATFKEYIQDPQAKIPEHQNDSSPASRTSRTSTTFGLTSSSSMPRAISKNSRTPASLIWRKCLRRRV